MKKEASRSPAYRARKLAWQRAHKAKASIRAKRNERRRSRWRTDPSFKIAQALRSRLYGALRARAKAGSAVELLGCTVAEAIAHLERQFQRGMTWRNWGEWHVDHIRPLAGFDLTDAAHLAQACHFTNLRPAWAAENLSKGAKALYLL